MNKLTKEEIEQQLERIREQEQQNQNLVRLIQKTNPKELEQERFNNMTDEERRILRR